RRRARPRPFRLRRRDSRYAARHPARARIARPSPGHTTAGSGRRPSGGSWFLSVDLGARGLHLLGPAGNVALDERAELLRSAAQHFTAFRFDRLAHTGALAQLL